MRGPLSIAAPAKINLYLHIVGKRDDGFHLLDSLIAFAGVGDVVTVDPVDEDLTFTIDGPYAAGLAADGTNLVPQAAKLLSEATKAERKGRISLTKNLPVAAGLGGGSMDAAAALYGLCRLWNVAPPRAELLEIAEHLGADVPVCVQGRAAFVGGIGERIDPAPALPAAWLVLANPNLPVPTPAVFAARQGEFSEPARFDQSPRDAAELAQLLAIRSNDLTEAAISVEPAISPVLNALSGLPDSRLARLSGSGATCFALFGSEASARNGADILAKNQPGWWIKAAPLLASTQISPKDLTP